MLCTRHIPRGLCSLCLGSSRWLPNVWEPKRLCRGLRSSGDSCVGVGAPCSLTPSPPHLDGGSLTRNPPLAHTAVAFSQLSTEHVSINNFQSTSTGQLLSMARVQRRVRQGPCLPERAAGPWLLGSLPPVPAQAGALLLDSHESGSVPRRRLNCSLAVSFCGLYLFPKLAGKLL